MATKQTFITALAIGALISTALLITESLTDQSIAVMGWEMPGIGAAYLFWGAVGSSVAIGVAICWLVNGLIYGLGAFAVLSVLNIFRRSLAL